MAKKSHSESLQGIMALDSPYTGIVDWRMVALQYGKDFEEAGGTVVTDYEVNDISMATESPAGSTEGDQKVQIISLSTQSLLIKNRPAYISFL